ncbi:hypothetical protein [Candidatus Pelagadaptatus aseana]|uniref:hypothetical protein n=1 Tax=Candidatus Pelagadaptatus aseana TaxID=3120508 RepID=UPI003C70183C
MNSNFHSDQSNNQPMFKLRLVWLVTLLWCLGSGLMPAHADSSSGALSSAALPSDVLRLGCLSSLGMPDTEFLQSIMQPVLDRHGMRLEIVQMPPEQITQSIREGSVDGDCGRSAYYSSLFDGALIRVEPAFRNETVVVWGRKDKRDLAPEELALGFPKGWNSIKYDVLALGYKGWRIFEDLDQVAREASAGNVDAFVSYYAAIDVRMPQLQQMDLVYHRDLYTVPVYVHLAKRFEWLLPELKQAIRLRKQASPYPDYDVTQFEQRDRRHIVFGCSVPPKYPAFEQVKRFYQQAFGELGYDFTLVPLPRAREVAEVLNGRLDGSCARPNVAPFSSSAELIQLEVPVARATPQLLTHIKDLSGVAAAAHEAKLAYVRGGQWAGQKFGLLGDRKSIGVTTVDIGIKMLAAKRIGFFVDNSLMQDTVLGAMKIDTPLYRHSLGEPYYLYPFIKRSHQELVKPLEQQLRIYLEKNATEALVED